MLNLMHAELVVEEEFSKNKIHCTIGTTDAFITVGFTGKNKLMPMTLLLGDELNWNKVFNVELIARRKKGEYKFNEITYGTQETYKKYKSIFDKIE